MKKYIHFINESKDSTENILDILHIDELEIKFDFTENIHDNVRYNFKKNTYFFYNGKILFVYNKYHNVFGINYDDIWFKFNMMKDDIIIDIFNKYFNFLNNNTKLKVQYTTYIDKINKHFKKNILK